MGIFTKLKKLLSEYVKALKEALVYYTGGKSTQLKGNKIEERKPR